MLSWALYPTPSPSSSSLLAAGRPTTKREGFHKLRCPESPSPGDDKQKKGCHAKYLDNCWGCRQLAAILSLINGACALISERLIVQGGRHWLISFAEARSSKSALLISGIPHQSWIARRILVRSVHGLLPEGTYFGPAYLPPSPRSSLIVTCGTKGG
ncbi:hypothetical protein AB1N83_013016 [Pleurotus pulmonarius]